ncbi:PIG-L family deacetylase [Streptomyces yangpuensis]|uniref:PIG-L family deacetylase n=1 Tax=Streptomyces yangpuensis TaxID=1648182 RepID=UPI0007C74F2A|nr:PIG-L family deacetylase [Streptomyces yangpuensis]
MSLASRTRLAALLAALTVGAAGVTTWAHGDTDAHPAAPHAPLRPSVTEGTVLQLVAHPDDDLFFMNPDLSRSISTGIKVTTVYLTAGESDGRNEARSPHLQDPARPADHAAYAEARQNGIRAAYAEMATGRRTSTWQRTSIPTAGGGSAEVDVLLDRPEVNLVWMQMREARSISGDNPDSLRGLWDGKIPALGSQLASHTPVTTPFTYTKDQAVQAIAGILARYKPTTIRTQDPTPGRTRPDGAFHDHQDHMYGARFVQAATERYAALTDRPHFSVQNYVSYPNSSLPPTLDAKAAEEKLGYLKTYAWSDHQDWCGSPAGCGDRKTATRPTGAGWNQTIRYSRGESTTWMTEGTPGRLHAFAALDGQMAHWTRPGPTADWQGPRFLPATAPGTTLDAGVSTARLPDGRIAVLATRTTLGTTAQDYRRDTVYALQSAPGAGFGPWHSLGTPDTGDTSATTATGAPTAAVDTTGRITVYVRDSRRTLRARTQPAPDTAFGPWQTLGGTALQGDPVTATDRAGRRHLYAATDRTVLAWTQPAPGAPLAGPFPTGLPATTGVLSATAHDDGVRLSFRRPGTGTVTTTLATITAPAAAPAAGPAAGPVLSPPADAGGEGGYGAVGTAGHLLTGRAATGTAAVTLPGQTPAWHESQMLYTGAPAALTAPDGTGLAAALGLDAGLHLTTTPPPAPTAPAPPAPWHRAIAPTALAPTALAQAARRPSGRQR